MPSCVSMVVSSGKMSLLSGLPCPVDTTNTVHFVLQKGSEYSLQPTLADIFNIPVVGDLQQMFSLGFMTPMIAYLTAWAFQAVISMIDDNNHH